MEKEYNGSEADSSPSYRRGSSRLSDKNMPEEKRGCGYRKVGAMYLCGMGIPVECDRLPYELTVCRVCGAGVKQSRGFTWLDWFEVCREARRVQGQILMPVVQSERRR